MVPSRLPSQTFRVLVTTSWIPGGVTTWTHEFANQLTDRGHEVTCVIVRVKWLPLREPPLFRDVRYKVVWLDTSPLSLLSVVPRFLSSYLRDHPFEVIVSTEAEGTNLTLSQNGSRFPSHVSVMHIPEPTSVNRTKLALGSLGLSNAMLRIPLLYMKGRRDLVERLMPWYWQWVHFLGRRRLERTRTVVCVSHSQSQSVQNTWGIPTTKIRVIYNGIDTERFLPLERRQGRERRLLFVGGANPRKGVDVLLDAFALINNHYPDVFLDLVGGWDWTAQMEKAKRLGISSQVCFHPYVVHDEMPAFYAQSYASIAPTKAESFGRTVAEAMACGVPVICAGTGALPEIVENGVSGILVPWGDTHALADAIRELLNHPQKAREMGREGRKRVEKSFAWDVVIPQWEALFGRVSSEASLAKVNT